MHLLDKAEIYSSLLDGMKTLEISMKNDASVSPITCFVGLKRSLPVNLMLNSPHERYHYLMASSVRPEKTKMYPHLLATKLTEKLVTDDALLQLSSHLMTD